MFKQWLYENAYGILATALSGTSIFAFLSERKKRKILLKKDESIAKQEEANALETIQVVYDKFVKDSLDRYIDLISQINEVKAELRDVYMKLDIVTNQLNEEKSKNDSLRSAYEELLKKYEGVSIRNKVKS